MSNFHSMRGVTRKKKIIKWKQIYACPLSCAFFCCPPLIIVLYTGILSIPMQVWCNWFKNDTEVVYMPSCLLCPYLTSEKKNLSAYHKGQLISCDLPITSCLGLGRRCLHLKLELIPFADSSPLSHIYMKVLHLFWPTKPLSVNILEKLFARIEMYLWNVSHVKGTYL